MIEYVNCNLCENNNFIVLYRENTDYSKMPEPNEFSCSNINYGKHGQIVKCKDCGLVYMNPRRNAAIIHEMYGIQEDNVYYDERRGRNITFLKALEDINSVCVKKGKLLDVGCGIGLFLRLARSSKWDIEGIEPSKWATRIARDKYRLNVQTGTLKTAKLFNEKFDVITMWDVIEHCTDPLGELKLTNSVLKKNGYLFLTTMDLDSFVARLMGRRWWWLMEMHLFYFTRETIKKLLGEAGFEIVSIKKHARYITLSYLISRSRKLSRLLSYLPKSLFKKNRWRKEILKIKLGDIITVAARKKESLNLA